MCMSVSSWKVSLCSLLTGLHQLFRAMLCWQTVLYCLQSKLLWAHKVQESILPRNSLCTKTMKVLNCILVGADFCFAKTAHIFHFELRGVLTKHLRQKRNPLSDVVGV